MAAILDQSNATTIEDFMESETIDSSNESFTEDIDSISQMSSKLSEDNESELIQIGDYVSCPIKSISISKNISVLFKKHVIFNNFVTEFHRDVEPRICKTYSPIKQNSSTQKKDSNIQKRIASFQDNNKLDNQFWPEIIQSKKKKISIDNFKKYLRRTIISNANTCILIGNVKFKCSLSLLQCYSNVFLNLDNEIFIKLPESKITPRAFQIIYNWILQEDAKLKPQYIIEVFEAAYFLKITSLIRQCWTCFDDETVFSEYNAFLFYKAITLLKPSEHLVILKHLLFTRIRKFFMTLVVSTDYVNLGPNEVIQLLSSNQIAVHNEIEVFFAALRWLNTDWEIRKEFIVDIVQCVRFKSIRFWFLIFLYRDTKCERINRVINHPVIKNLINEAIVYITAVLYWDGKGDLETYITDLELQSPDTRRFVEDTTIDFYMQFENILRDDVSYEIFVSYLQNIRKSPKTYWLTLKYMHYLNSSIITSYY